MASEAVNFDVDQAHASLGFTMQRARAIIKDLEAQRGKQRKWLPASDRAGVFMLNPAYPLDPNEKDVFRLHAMWRLLGSKDAIEQWYKHDISRRVLTTAQKKFLADNKALFDRFLNQHTLLYRELDPADLHHTAREWLKSHNWPVDPDPQKAVQLYRSIVLCSFDQVSASLVPPDYVQQVSSELGLVLEDDHVANVTNMCRNTLHDDPYHPISLAEHMHTLIEFESSDKLYAALVRGVGAVRSSMVAAADLLTDLRALGLPAIGDKTDQWHTLFTHMYNTATREFLINWLRNFGFSLVERGTADGRDRAVDPSTLTKRVLFALLGEFASGDIVCEQTPGVAVSLTPLQHMLETVERRGVQLPPHQRESPLALFPSFCDLMRARGMPKTAPELRLTPQATKMDVLDKLLDDGVYATMKITPSMGVMIDKFFQGELPRRSDPAFESALRDLLRRQLLRFNGAFLRSWLDQHDMARSRVVGLDNMLKHYSHINICHHGFQARDANRVELPVTDSAKLSKALERARIEAAGDPQLKGVIDLEANHDLLSEACAAVTHRAEEERSPDPDVKRSRMGADRMEQVEAALCALDMFYINPGDLERDEKKQLLRRMEATLDYVGQSKSKADEDLRFDEAKLWMEALVSTPVLQKLMATRLLPDYSDPKQNLDFSTVGRDGLLQALAASNLHRFRVIKAWAANYHRGMLCYTEGSDDLKRKLETLHVKVDAMKDKARSYYFMNILHAYLSDQLVSQFLTATDRKALMAAGADIKFNECYAKYCERYNAGVQVVKLALSFNGRLAARMIVKLTETEGLLGVEGSSPECATREAKATLVTENTITVTTATIDDNAHLYYRREDGSVDQHHIDGETKVVDQKQTFVNHTLPSLIKLQLASGERLLTIDGVPVKS